MSQGEDHIRMRHMLDAAIEAHELIEGCDRSILDSDRVLTLALTRLLEVVGEAAARITTATRHQHGEIPWRQIVGLRNRLIHGYDSIDHDILWAILTQDLEPLIEKLDAILDLAHKST